MVVVNKKKYWDNVFDWWKKEIWHKIEPNKDATLRGHTPVIEWRKKYNSNEFSIITIYRMTSGKGKGKYLLEIWLNGKFNTTKTFDKLNDCVNFAKKYMGG